ncbi:MAG: orotate phosphoribosyltransferase [Bacteroidetes bacterium]|nr:orotate phosphoribosyltransferase [Bacteroidota bacterium]
MGTTASNIADFLLQIKAVKLQPKQPFTWASGWKSPIYCDNRIILSHPRIRTYIRQELVKVIDEKFGPPDVIAGVATGAIAHGVLVAEAMGLPFVYIRSSAKEHGRQNLIEGEISKNQSCVVIEDLISTGQSSLKAVNALRENGVLVKGMIAIFNYGFDVASDAFRVANCPVYSLSNYDVLINQALNQGYIGKDDLENLKLWKTEHANWNPL